MKSFKSLGVCDELIQALQKQGIKEPTPIQEQAIPVVFKGNDVIAKAQTGTGKNISLLITYSSTGSHRCASRTSTYHCTYARTSKTNF